MLSCVKNTMSRLQKLELIVMQDNDYDYQAANA